MTIGLLWSFSYVLLTRSLMRANPGEVAAKLAVMTPYRLSKSWVALTLTILTLILIKFIPLIGITSIFITLGYVGVKTAPDSDRLFEEENRR